MTAAPSGASLLRWLRMLHNWFALLAAGVVCGFLNAAASSGSAVSLPLLLALGLPPAVANGTNRLPVLVGLATAGLRFQRQGAIPWRFCLRLLPVFLIAAATGAWLAAMLPMDQIRGLVHVALLLALLLVLLKPQRWLGQGSSQAVEARPSPLLLWVMAAVGLWTGLIVLDAATYMLVALVLVGGLTLPQANAVKVVLIGAGTLLALLVFAQGGQVDWRAALPLTLGSALGGWLGAALALGPHARQWIYRLLILALSVEVLLSLLARQLPMLRPMVV